MKHKLFLFIILSFLFIEPCFAKECSYVIENSNESSDIITVEMNSSLQTNAIVSISSSKYSFADDAFDNIYFSDLGYSCPESVDLGIDYDTKLIHILIADNYSTDVDINTPFFSNDSALCNLSCGSYINCEYEFKDVNGKVIFNNASSNILYSATFPNGYKETIANYNSLFTCNGGYTCPSSLILDYYGGSSSSLTYLSNIHIGNKCTNSNCFIGTLVTNNSKVCNYDIENLPSNYGKTTAYYKDNSFWSNARNAVEEINDTHSLSADDSGGYEFCNQKNTLKVFDILHKIITIVKIIVPLGLIVISTIELFKCFIKNDNDGIAKTTKKLVTKIIIGVLIFFIPTIINAIISYVDKIDDNMNACQVCFTGNPKGECNKYIESAEE